MKVLSVKQPWSYLLCRGIKDIENRTWKLPEKYKNERVLIHASGSHGKKFNIQLTDEQMLAAFGTLSNEAINGKYNFGAIIGSVRFTDCVINHPSIWAEKTKENRVWANGTEWFIPQKPIYNWLAADPILFDKPILNVKGKLGFWEYSHPMCCPICGYPLHLQKTGDIITDAFCFICKKDVLHYEKILCPYCKKVCLHDNSDVGVPNWGNPVHQCEHCNEMILESDYEILK